MFHFKNRQHIFFYNKQPTRNTNFSNLFLEWESYSKNKLEKLVILFGFNIRICHDARSSERQIQKYVTMHGHLNVRFKNAFVRLGNR